MPTTDFESKVDATSENIQESDKIHERNKALIREYQRDQTLNGLTDATLARNLSRLKVVAEQVDEPFDEMDKADVKDIIEWVHSRDYTESTIYTYKNVIRSFWKWMNPTDDGEVPAEVSWITMNPPGSNNTLPTDLLTKEDIQNQIDAAKNPRDKAFISMLYETGARIGELIDLTVGDIEDRTHGKKITIEGKTGARRLPLVESVPYINKWLNDHPNPTKNAPLWCKIQQGEPDDKLGYRYLREKVLKKNMERADIDKPSNPHHYRHSRASYLANEMTEAQLCEWFGWVQGSDVPARYVHLSGRDIDNAYDQMHGLYEPEEDEEEPDVRECPRCDELNEPDAMFCQRCGFALEQHLADSVEEMHDTATEAAIESTDPEKIEGEKAVREATNPENRDAVAELMARIEELESKVEE